MVAGDEAVFTELYERHRREVYAFLLGRVDEPEAARDLLQETFLRAWRHLATIRALAPTRQRAWIFTVARNVVTDGYRSRAAGRAAYDELRHTTSALAPGHEEPAVVAEMRSELSLLDAAIRALPDELRLILTLCTVGEMTSARVGELLDQPAGTIRYKLNQARTRLAEALKEVRPA
jgi:RNA polymerase sigma-70 factor, ECF subfamily